MKFVSRAEWGAQYAKGSGSIPGPVYGVTLHWEGPRMGNFPHTACAGKVRVIERFHAVTRGWSGIAYNALVCPHGYVFEGRGIGVRSAANGTSDIGGNDHWYAVCYLSGEGDPLTDAGKQGMTDAVRWLRRKGNAGAKTNGHRDHHATQCPGDAIYAWLNATSFHEEPKPPAPKPKPAPKPLPVPDCEDRAILRVGTWNLEHGRKPSVVAREFAEFRDTADVWILNEADDYADMLATIPDWTWHAGTKAGQDKTGILARTSLGGTFRLHPGSEQGWFTATGKRTAPKWIPELDVAGVRIYGIHFPPSIERGGRHLPTLPLRRWAVYKEQMNSLVALLKPRGPVIVGGDWNVDANADKGGAWFPRSQMAELNLTRDKNRAGTHGSRCIDVLWARDVICTATKLGPKTGSDHRAVVATYEIRSK